MNIPYGRQHISDEDIQAVVEVLKSDYLTQGPRVKEFEAAFSKEFSIQNSVAVTNGTAALHLAMQALGLSRGDQIITTPISFAATANAALYCGAEVIFCDIDPETYNLCPDHLAKLLTSDQVDHQRLKGVAAVDFAGLPFDYDRIGKLCKKYDLWLLEDACHAPGAKYGQFFAGAHPAVDASSFSFHPVKHIACGEGGMVATRHSQIAERVAQLRTHGIGDVQDPEQPWLRQMVELGQNYRITDILCALGISQLSRISSNIESRNQIAANYREKLGVSDRIKFQKSPENYRNAHHLFVIEVENRKELYLHLREQKIFSQIHYLPIYKHPFYQQNGYQDLSLANAENYYEKCLSLPIYPTLQKDDVERIANIVLDFVHRT